MQAEVNKLGKTLADYKCKTCGYLHANLFIENKPLRRCYRCHKKNDGEKINE